MGIDLASRTLYQVRDLVHDLDGPPRTSFGFGVPVLPFQDAA